MSNKIAFYDFSLASDHDPRKIFSPNAWKVRYALNIKGLDFETVWLQYHEIEPTITKLGGKPTATKPDGTPWYTIPVIFDPSTKQIVSNSRDIGEYLDKQYPATPKIILDPVFETEWEEIFLRNIMEKIPPSTFLVLHNRVSPLAAKHVRRIREAQFGTTLEDLSKEEDVVLQWKGFEKGHTDLSEYYKRAGTTFLSKGKIPMWADLVVGSWLIAQKFVYGEDSKEWKAILGWDGGLWNELNEALQVYEGEGVE